MYKLKGTGKAQIGKMDVILRDSGLDARITRRLPMNVIVPKLEYAEKWKGNADRAKKLEAVHTTLAKKTLECSKTRNTVLRAELGMYPLEANRVTKKLK
ncbi:unnamed protein product [Sphacelaria rigidula]